jgi:hypothetical protein
MKLEKINLIEITNKEASKINGGESGWYWLMYGLGRALSNTGSSNNSFGNANYYK